MINAPVKKRSVSISGHATSVTIEDPFWDILKKMAKTQNKSVQQLIAEIDDAHQPQNLSSALRLYVLQGLTQS